MLADKNIFGRVCGLVFRPLHQPSQRRESSGHVVYAAVAGVMTTGPHGKKQHPGLM